MSIKFIDNLSSILDELDRSSSPGLKFMDNQLYIEKQNIIYRVNITP